MTDETNQDFSENRADSEAIGTEKDKLEAIIKSGSVVSKKDGDTIHCLTVIGQIEGHYLLPTEQKTTKYEHLIPLLVSIEQSDEIDGVLIVLNTMGGDVEAGLALAEMVASKSLSYVQLFCDSMECSPPGSSVHGMFQATGVGCHFLLQGIFLT